MKLKTLTSTLLLSGLLLSGCAHTTQMTSGQDYLSKYTPATYTQTAANTGERTIDQQVRDIATIEPNLHFPARIGLARIQGGELTTAPEDEMLAWGSLSETLGAPYGEFVPVSPFIAAMVRPDPVKQDKKYYQQPQTNLVVADIRRASARQHLDYVLVYEVNQNVSKKSNALALADLTVLGLYVLPSRSVKIDSTANAMLIDVRNGYPYGTATAYATDKQVRTVMGSSNSRKKSKDKNYSTAVVNLTSEVETMMKNLWALQAKQ